MSNQNKEKDYLSLLPKTTIIKTEDKYPKGTILLSKKDIFTSNGYCIPVNSWARIYSYELKEHTNDFFTEELWIEFLNTEESKINGKFTLRQIPSTLEEFFTIFSNDKLETLMIWQEFKIYPIEDSGNE